MSGRLPSARLQAWLEAWRDGVALAPADAAALLALRRSARLAALREAAIDRADPDAAGLARTVVAVDALARSHAGESTEALALLAGLLDRPLEPHPLGANPERFAARLAVALGNTVTAERFAARAHAYDAAFGGADALAGISPLLLHGDVAACLAAGGPPSPPTAHAPSAFVPQAAGEATTRAYVVTVGHAGDATGTRFELHRATLSDITEPSPDGPPFADLVLAFEDDATPMLERLDVARLELRCVFGGSTAFERFDQRSGALFDVESAPAERRLYLRLRLPSGWTAAGVALDDVWSSLESCVLVEDGAA